MTRIGITLGIVSACSGRAASNSAGADGMSTGAGSGSSVESTMATAAEGDATVATADSSTTDGGPAIDPCEGALVGSVVMNDVDYVGDFEGDGVGELFILGRAAGDSQLKGFIVAADAPPTPGDYYGFRVVQEIRFGPGFPNLDGALVGALDDVNADGRLDVGVVVRVPGEIGTHIRAYILLGEASPAATREVRIDGLDGPGWWVDGPFTLDTFDPPRLDRAGDTNCDGIDDFFFNPSDGSSIALVQGRPEEVPIDLTDPGVSGVTTITYAVEGAEHRLHTIPLALGDLDGDGCGETMLPNPPYSTSLMFGTAAPADIVLHPMDGGGDATWLSSAVPYSSIGTGAAPAGDLNADGHGDLWLGAWYTDYEVGGDDVCSSPGPPGSLYWVDASVKGSTTTLELDEGNGGGIAVGPCGLGGGISTSGDWNGNGTFDLLTLDGAGIWWLDGSLLRAESLPLTATDPHQSWWANGCETPSGTGAFNTLGARFFGLVPDVTGDGIDDAWISIVEPDPPNSKDRLAVLPGRGP